MNLYAVNLYGPEDRLAPERLEEEARFWREAYCAAVAHGSPCPALAACQAVVDLRAFYKDQGRELYK